MTQREVWQATITNTSGSIVPDAQITVYEQDGITLATIYGSLTGGTKPNPFVAGSDGVARFYAQSGRYVVRAFKDSQIAERVDVDLSMKALRDDLGDPSAEVNIVDSNGDSVVALRADLSAQFGAGRIANNVVTLNSIKELAAIPMGLRRTDLQYSLSSFWPELNLGSGLFVWNPDRPKADHNGGTVVDPDKLSDLGSVGEFQNYFEPLTNGDGCFERIGFAPLRFPEVCVSYFGATGDREFDDILPIQAALNYVGEPDLADTPFIRNGAGIVKLFGIHRITDTLYMPSWTLLEGNYPGAITSPYTSLRNKGTVILADFSDENKTALSACGFFLDSGERINLIHDLIGPNTYDGGNMSRRYGVGIRNLVLATEGDVKIGFAVAGAPSFTIRDVSISGFLNGVSAHSSWGCTVSNLNIRAKHVCWMGYNIKASSVSGYWSGMGFGENTPELTQDTAIVGFYQEHPIHNPESIRFYTTCIYEQYSSANTYKVTLENMQRGIAGFEVYSADFTGMYLERIHNLPVQSVACNYTFDSPRIWNPGTGFIRASSSGKVLINTPGAAINTWDAGSQDSFGARAQVRVVLRDQREVPVNEKRSPAISFSFLREEPLTIFASSSGDPNSTGLVENAPVPNLQSAFDSAEYYRAKEIRILGGEQVPYTQDRNLGNSEYKIVGGENSAIIWNPDRTLRLLNSNISFENISLLKPVTGSSTSSRGLIRLDYGINSVSFSSVSISGSGSEAVFLPGNGAASILNVCWGGGISVSNLRKGNNAFSDSNTTVVESIAPNASIGGPGFSSNFRVI